MAIDVDYIATNHETMIDSRGKYIFLIGDNQLDLFETEKIKDLILHPIIGRKFIPEELDNIAFHGHCYQQDLEITQEKLMDFINWYVDARKSGLNPIDLSTNPDTEQYYNIVRFYMIPTDFQSHFRNFNPQDSDQEKYERDLAEKALQAKGIPGTWLLRHSSKNRPLEEENQQRLKRMGIRYYVLSYINRKTHQIVHILIEYSIGKGYQIYDLKFTNFLDALEHVLTKNRLIYAERISDYGY